MAINKIVLNTEAGEQVLVDLTGDTVVEDALVEGYTAHGANGEVIAGANPYEKAGTDTEVQTQTELLEQAALTLERKAAGGGSDGGYYIPSVDAAGNLTWQPSKEDMPEVEGANIKGDSPVKGEDYWTDADKQAIIDSVIAAIDVPSIYRRINYIQSSGTQWIDTVYSPHTDNVVYECKWVEPSLCSVQTLFGSTNSTNANGKWSASHYHPSAGQIYVALANTDGACKITGKLAAGTENTLRTAIYNNSIVFTVNGTTATATYSGSIQNGTNIALFGNKQSNGSVSELCKMRLYLWRMYDNGALVRDMVPVQRISDGAYGMYDKVSKLFYGNSGSGSFTGA